MTRPWPDEVRAMVDAISLEGVSVHVAPHVGGWRVFTPGASADYDPASQCWIRGHATMPADVALDYLLREARVSARSQSLSACIVAAVPTARVIETADGIEVRVGSKSVRWKREQRGWSLADDLFCSDDRVVEHAKQMAADAAPRPLIDRLREAVPGLEWEIDEEGDTLGVEAGVCEWDVWLTPRALRCFRDRFDEPHAVSIKRPSDDEVVRIVTEWYAKTHPAPAAPSLLDRLRTAIPSLTWEQVSEGEWIGRDAHDRDVARIVWRIDLGKRQEYIVACGTGHDDPNAYQASVTSADEAIDRVQRYVGETVARLEAPAAPQPSPQAQALLDALRAQGYEPEHKWVGDGEHVVCENEQARRANDLPGWTYLGGQAGTEYVAEQMHLRISRRRERKAAETATQATGADLGRGSDKTVLVQMEFKPGPEWAALAAAASKEALDQVKQAHAAKGATTMTTLDQAKVDASEAALRTAAKQLAKAARDPLAGAVARHLAPGDDGMRARVAAMLETEAGLAMLKALLSLAIGAIPQAGTRGAALAHELRVQAMADGADLALDLVMGPLREVVALYLQDPGGTPAAPALPEADRSATSVDWSTTREVTR